MPRHDIAAIKGVIPAMVTPFGRDGALDETRLRAVARALVARGVDGLYLTGSTGEGFLMSPEERRQVVAAVTEEVAGKIPVIVHVGAISVYHSVALAQHAQSCGVDAISSVPPIYWPFSADRIFGYYRDITASTDLPMIAYNISLAGAMGFDLIQRLASIRGVRGVKYTAPTHFEIMRMKAEIGQDFIVYSGADEMAMSGLAFGADGLIGSFYNIVPEIFQQITAAMQAGDVARATALQKRANALIFFTLRQYPMSAVKRIMAWQGADAGWCRAPFDNYDEAGEAALKQAYRAFAAENDVTDMPGLDALG